MRLWDSEPTCFKCVEEQQVAGAKRILTMGRLRQSQFILVPPLSSAGMYPFLNSSKRVLLGEFVYFLNFPGKIRMSTKVANHYAAPVKSQTSDSMKKRDSNQRQIAIENLAKNPTLLP